MEWQGLIQPRVLIVEDELPQLRGIERDLDEISDEERRALGIDKFVRKSARTVEEAEREFPGAGEAPLDLLILDLGIPEKAGGKDDSENGQRLLERVRREGIAKEVIVISIWWVVEQVARAFRSGAVDFISKKHLSTEVLQAKVLECWKRLLSKESARLLGEERIGELVPYAEKGLAHQFSACFSRLVRVVAQSAEEIEEHMHERYGLDRRKDSQDVFFQWLEGQKDSVARAKKEWEVLQSSLTLPDESNREETVDALLRDVNQQLLPCSIVKNVELKFSGESATPVLTFENDVRAVLKEIIAGAMNERQDYSVPKQAIEVNISGGKGQVEVSFADTLEPISPDDARQINEGVSVSPHLRFKREWGLSVVQHVAMRGGGRLQVSPQPERGNVITYFIPLAN
jgi:DNA-binding NarL/FixJ family response regulator